jgi:hypothetical protein
MCNLHRMSKATDEIARLSSGVGEMGGERAE